jgi:uncharacterized protein YndB with AHSA1/START domain
MLVCKAQIQIQKPSTTVFQAIVDPDHMSHYFILNSNGVLETGKSVIWHFPEFAQEDCPVHVKRIQPDAHIEFVWGTSEEATTVTINLITQADASTVVHVVEGEKPNNEQGLKWLVGNTEGWANFLACLKAYLEYGINLRKGAFDFMRAK